LPSRCGIAALFSTTLRGSATLIAEPLDVLAGLERPDGVLAVERVRHADCHHVDVLPVEYAEVDIDLRDAVLVGDLAGQGFVTSQTATTRPFGCF